MTAPSETIPATTRTTFRGRFLSFVAERHPFALKPASAALDSVIRPEMHAEPVTQETLDTLRPELLDALRTGLAAQLAAALRESLPPPSPAVPIETRLEQAQQSVIDDCEGFLLRESISASLNPDERREILRGMILTRAVDNRLKAFFSGGEVRYGKAAFQGKGFRSLGQEAIYAAAIRLRRGSRYRREGDGIPAAERWRGDVVAPLIRDLGVALAMHPERETADDA